MASCKWTVCFIIFVMLLDPVRDVRMEEWTNQTLDWLLKTLWCVLLLADVGNLLDRPMAHVVTCCTAAPVQQALFY